MTKNISNKKLRIWFIFWGILCFTNPTVHLIDVIPDAIGSLLVVYGLSRVSTVIESFEEARIGFLRLSAVQGIRLIISVFSQNMADITKLLFVFLFAVIEAIIFIPSVTKIFQGIEYMSLRYSTDMKLDVNTGKAKKITIIMYIIKSVISVLPITTSLFTTSNVIADEYDFGLQNFTNLYYLFAGVFVFILAIIWIVSLTKFFRCFSKDVTAFDAVYQLYNENYAIDDGKIISGRMKVAILLLTIATPFLFNPYMDYVNVFPNLIVALIVIAVVIFMTVKYNFMAISIIGSSIIWAVLSFISLILQRNYVGNNYTPESAEYGIRRAVELYTKIEIVSGIESLFFLVTMVLLIIYTAKLLNKHIAMLSDTIKAKAVKSVKMYIPSIIFIALTFAVDVVEPYLMTFFAEIWLIRAGIVILLFVFTLRACVSVNDNIYFKLREHR